MLPPKQILFAGTDSRYICQDLIGAGYTGLSFTGAARAVAWLAGQMQHRKKLPDVILCDAELEDGDAFVLYNALKKLRLDDQIQFVILARHDDTQLRRQAHQSGIDDVFLLPVNPFDVHYRLQYITAAKVLIQNLHADGARPGRPAFHKRAFDVVFSLTTLILLSPVLLLIAALVKLESRGPVLYVSKRAGSQYRIFNFYKFRTMRLNADAELPQLMAMNQYKNSSFIKIRNDPRVTRLGVFLRNTSLDELPQLFNVLRGDMSIVGNRPLPLYEATHLTTDEFAARFLAPAGITGLWQVTKRGHKDMTDLERKNLDIQYTEVQSFLMDSKILIKTISALRQKENV